MRKYYIQYWNDFANTYNLIYTEGSEPAPDNAERITRAEALRRCREAAALIAAGCPDPYRPAAIIPASLAPYHVHPATAGYTLRGHIWQR